MALSCLLSACGGKSDDSGDTCNHVDVNDDGLCDNCGEPFGGGDTGHSEHVDLNGDGKCDLGGEPMGSIPVDPGKDDDKDDPGKDDDKDDPDKGDYSFGDSNYFVSTDGLLKENIVNDKYGTFYEIGVQSYCDSNGDNVGDLQGIISRLPYIRGMGYTGIWLTPVVDAWPRQYGYGARDYMKIYPAYGTFADFDELIEKAHELGIKVICDMVFNHTSDSGCAWWNQAFAAQKSGDTTNEYYGFYNFSKRNPGTSNWEQRDGWYFECSQYYGGMPDLNLDNPKVKEKLAEVIKLWVGDHHIDGMRLDAVKNYFNDQPAKNKAFVDWIVTEAQKYNPNIYVVGEVYSGKDGADGTNAYYSGTKADSFFWFEDGYFPDWHDGTIGYWVNTVVNNASQASSAADNYFTSMQSMISGSAGKIPAPFLDQHDTDRVADALFKHNATKIKFAHGLLSMYTGNTFTYYGDEIAMNGTRTMSESDGQRRMGFLWDTNNPPKIQVDDVAPNYANVTGALQQIADSASILNYYKEANNLRNAFPAIIRGTPTKVSNNGGVLTIKKTWNGQTVHIVINFTGSQKQATSPAGTFQKAICPSGKATGSGSSVTLPAYSIAVFA